eukprot:scaffold8240_cov133-Cylindrotheca_fusiformis.AAC.11
MPTDTSEFRVGILGAAGIASKIAIAISSPDSLCVVSAIASRNLEKAKAFAAEYLENKQAFVPTVFGGPEAYDDLIASDVADALYIPLPVTIKKEWVIKALKSGKHVVMEKPAALSVSDYQEMLDVAYSNNKFLMDGTMFPHHPRTHHILDSLLGIGDIIRIESSFTFLADQAFLDGSNIRARKDGDPQGCIGDLGWYCIRYALMVFGKLGCSVESAQVVDYSLNKHGVPMVATCAIRFQNDKVLWFHSGFNAPLRQHFEVCGSKKSIYVDDLVLPGPQPVSYTVKSSTLTDNDLLTIDETECVRMEIGPVHEVLLWKKFQSIARSLDGATIDSPSENEGWRADDTQDLSRINEWASISRTNQAVIDALMQSIKTGGVINI